MGADECINHTEEEWSEKYNEPFDVIIDCAEGVQAWRKANKNKLLRRGWNRSRFVACVLGTWEIHMDTYMQLVGFILSPVSRTFRTGYSAGLTPRY